MQTALETLFLSIPRDRRVFPEDDPQAHDLIEKLRRGMNEEQKDMFFDLLNRTTYLIDEQAFQCFAEGVRCGLSIGVAWWDPGDYPVKTGIPCR